jgi:hypothetical protein
MADQKISQLPAATTPLSGTELVPLVQGGANVKATVQDIANLAGGGGTSFSALSISYTGTMGGGIQATLIPAQSYQVGNDAISASGKWAATITIDPSNVRLTSVTFNDLVGIATNFQNNVPGITTLNFPSLKFSQFALSYSATLSTISAPELLVCSGIVISATNTSLTSVSFPKLKYLGILGSGNNISLTQNPNLATIDFPLLEGCYGSSGVSITSNALTTLNLPSLKYVRGGIGITSTSLTSVSLPVLEAVVTLQINSDNLPNCTSYSVPALRDVYSTGSSALQCLGSRFAFSFPAIETIGYNQTSGTSISIANGSVSFTLGSGLKYVFGNVDAASGALNQASVDNILVRLAALDGTNGTTSYNNKTITMAGSNAAPSATGLAAKSTLIARGCTVTTN